MDPAGLQTPIRKRPRSTTPFSSSRHPNKRARSNSLISPSPKVVRFDPLSHGEDLDTHMESDVPESPILARRGVSVLGGGPVVPLTPGEAEIGGPFAKLTLKTPAHRKGVATPIAAAMSGDRTKSLKKSSRKIPGSVKSSKPLSFRIKVRSHQAVTDLVIINIPHRSSGYSNASGPDPSKFVPHRLASWIVPSGILHPSCTIWSFNNGRG
jgi:hypothetical protein